MNHEPIFTTQLTSKRFKAQRLIGAALAVLGVVLVFTPLSFLGVLLMLAGLGTMVASRIGAWWENG